MTYRRAWRGWWLVAVFAVACAPAPQTSNTPAEGSTLSASIVDPYLKIQQALADDSMDGVKANAGAGGHRRRVARRAGREDRHRRGAAGVGDRDRRRARRSSATLSEAIDAYMTGASSRRPNGVRVAFCPMVQKPWLQKDERNRRTRTTAKTMLTCGSFR